MYWTERQLFACTGNHCNQKGASQVIQRLRFELMRRKLVHQIHFNTCGTIDLCDVGPNIVVYPDNIILHNLKDSDIPDIVEFLMGGDIPERLVLNADDPMETNRRDFFASLNAAGNALSHEAVLAMAADHGLDNAWLSEQLKRGFMAKKPGEDDGPDRYSMTSKALHRYRLQSAG